MVVVGIIAALVAMLLPALARAREAARLVQCAANLHQIVVAVDAYVAQSHGRYPPNTSTPSPGLYWYDDERVGAYLPARRPPVPAGKPGGGVYVCPDDWPGNAFLGYSMNAWASSTLDAATVKNALGSAVQWPPHVRYASRMILFAETYSGTGSNSLGWYAPATAGSACASSGSPSYTPLATTAGERFGGAGGVVYTAGRFGKPLSELCYMRHRVPGTPGSGIQARGRLNVAYADGHVAAKTDRDLVGQSGQATGDSYWSPADACGN